MSLAYENFFNKLISENVRKMKLESDQDEAICVQDSDTLPTALRKLSSANVFAVPVIDYTDHYLGMLDMSDILFKTIDLLGGETEVRPLRFSPEYLAKKRQFRNTTVGGLFHLPNSDGTNVPINENYSLFHALEILSNSECHRLALVDEFNRVTGVITDSLFVDYLSKNKSLMPDELLSETLGNLRNYHSVNTILPNRRAITAFKLMKDKQIRAVAVVDVGGKLIDVISIRDLVGISPNSLTFRWLYNTTSYYLDQVRDQNLEKPISVVALPTTATFERLLDEFVDNKVHQIFLVDSLTTMRPIDMITLQDVLDFVLDSLQSPSLTTEM